jgi:hypothetical protein
MSRDMGAPAGFEPATHGGRPESSLGALPGLADTCLRRGISIRTKATQAYRMGSVRRMMGWVRPDRQMMGSVRPTTGPDTAEPHPDEVVPTKPGAVVGRGRAATGGFRSE